MKWFVDFSGYCVIEADSMEEAETKFWEGVQPPSEEAYDDVYDIDSIEKVEKEYDSPHLFLTNIFPKEG